MKNIVLITAYVLFVTISLGAQFAYNSNERLNMMEYRQGLLKQWRDEQQKANEKLVEIINAFKKEATKKPIVRRG